MTPNQRDVFLFSWSRRRTRGRLGNALLCAGIGAAGGVLFGLALAGDVASNGARSSVDALADLALLFGIAVPTFASLAGALGDRVFASNEAMYQRLLATGASPPTEEPRLRSGERGPQIAVAVTATVLVAFIVVVWVLYG